MKDSESGEKTRVPVRYLSKPVSTLYTNFKIFDSESDFKSTKFREMIKKIKYFKKPRRYTDLCEICESGKFFEKQILKFNKTMCDNHEHENLFIESCDNFRQRFHQLSEIQRDRYETLKQNYLVYLHHHEHKEHQRQCFKDSMVNLFSKNEAIIVIDFKSNISLDIAQREVGLDFYNQPQRVCFGATLIYQDSNGLIKYHYFDVFSKILSKATWFVIEIMKKIFNHQDFVNLLSNNGISNIQIWGDNAGHFKSLEFFFYFKNLDQFRNKSINYWGTHHGKSVCDARFSRIMNIIKQKTLEESARLDSMETLVRFIKESEFDSFRNRTYQFDGQIIYEEDINNHQKNSTQIILSFSDEDLHEIQLNRKKIKNKNYGINEIFCVCPDPNSDNLIGYFRTNGEKYGIIFKYI